MKVINWNMKVATFITTLIVTALSPLPATAGIIYTFVMQGEFDDGGSFGGSYSIGYAQ